MTLPLQKYCCNSLLPYDCTLLANIAGCTHQSSAPGVCIISSRLLLFTRPNNWHPACITNYQASKKVREGQAPPDFRLERRLVQEWKRRLYADRYYRLVDRWWIGRLAGRGRGARRWFRRPG